jgi:hypothetical protein
MHATWMLALWLGAADKPALAPAARVRSTHGAEHVLQDASRSETVRGLLDRLAASDVIVYVEMTTAADVPTARTKLVAATPSARFLRIAINYAQPLREWPSLLAHELQHAVEIAERPDVRDDAAIRSFYAAIGHQHGVDSYETDAAVNVERLVRTEMLGMAAARIPDRIQDSADPERFITAPVPLRGSRSSPGRIVPV